LFARRIANGSQFLVAAAAVGWNSSPEAHALHLRNPLPNRLRKWARTLPWPGTSAVATAQCVGPALWAPAVVIQASFNL